MRVLAVDIGEKRCGLALSDSRGIIATPLAIVPLSDAVNNKGAFAEAIEEWEPAMLLFGLPKSLSGKEGAQARRIRAVAGQISHATELPYEFVDERLSSAEAKVSLAAMGYDSKRMRGKVDSLAATLFLQTWLDLQRRDDGAQA